MLDTRGRRHTGRELGRDLRTYVTRDAPDVNLAQHCAHTATKTTNKNTACWIRVTADRKKQQLSDKGPTLRGRTNKNAVLKTRGLPLTC